MHNTARRTRDNRTITVDFRSEATYFQFCREGRFLEQNLKIGYQEFKNLQTPKLSKKQLCDRTLMPPGAPQPMGDGVDVELVVSHAKSKCIAIAIQGDDHDGGSPHLQHDRW